MAEYGPSPAVNEAQPKYAAFVHGEHTIEFTPDGTTDYGAGAGLGVPFGGVIVQGSLVGIAKIPIPPLQKGALAIDGVFDFVKAASDGGMAVGTLAYWDNSAKVATGTSSGNTYLGKVEVTALTADVIVRVSVEALANASGAATFGGMPVATVAAAGSTVSDAAALSVGMNIVTGADGTKGVVLPTAPAAGTIVMIKGTTSGTLKIYPDAAATINAISSHANYTTGTVAPVMLIATSTTQWYTFPLVAS